MVWNNCFQMTILTPCRGLAVQTVKKCIAFSKIVLLFSSVKVHHDGIAVLTDQPDSRHASTYWAVLNMLAEAITTELSKEHQPETFEEIYPSHGTCPVRPPLIMELYEATGKILNGQITGQLENMFGNPIVAYDLGSATFLCDPKETQ